VPAGRRICWSRVTVRRWLAENDLKPWRKDKCIAQVDAEDVARMENVLDLYAEEPDLGLSTPRLGKGRRLICSGRTPRRAGMQKRFPVALSSMIRL
jgi:hypothetical protein